MSSLVAADVRQLDLGELDILFLRNDPAADALTRPWAQLAGVNFGRLAEQAGALVVNSPDGLYHAVNKLYLQLFPSEVRPRTVITRDFDSVRAFLDEVGGVAVVKPLRGSGGHNVFLIRQDDQYNLRQIFDAVCREGYLISQEYLPASSEGDTRVFLMDGDFIETQGEIAAVHRVPARGDLRSNLTAGGRARKAAITQRVREIAELARPRLREDGMFFVGLDIIGDRMVEVNVFSPGALIAAERVAGVEFGPRVIEGLERRLVHHRRED
jgi:glutathione synthase